MRYEVVSDFMQQLPPRTIHHQLRNENLPRVPLVLWVMFSPMIVLGTVAITWGLLHAGGMVLAGHEAFVVFGAVNLLPVCAAWVFFCRRRVVYLRILREGVCASATVRIQGSTVDYGLEDWLTCKHKVDVHFWAGEESVNGEVTMNGMQMKTLQRCLDDGTELFVLYRKDCPKYFCLSTQFVSRRVPV